MKALWDAAYATAAAVIASDSGLSPASRGSLAAYLAQARCSGVTMEGGTTFDVVSILFLSSRELQALHDQAAFVRLLCQIYANLEAAAPAEAVVGPGALLPAAKA